MPNFIIIILMPLMLIACSPHPGTGTWLADSENKTFSKIIVHYDGKAEIFEIKNGSAEWHCFWAGINKTDINLMCTPASNPDDEQSFSFSISDSNMTNSVKQPTKSTQAKLYKNTVLTGTFNLQERK
ncbi:MAG: hypothetical protein OQK73_07720 [Gammaproteobacteria bacterium]|nr:hypothetical protein [Gammaproteobacteria bacterium]